MCFSSCSLFCLKKVIIVRSQSTNDYLSAAPGQKSARVRLGEVGQRSSSHGQTGSCLDPSGPLVRRLGERLRPAPGRPVRTGHEEGPHSARAGAGERERQGQRQRTHVGSGGRIH